MNKVILDALQNKIGYNVFPFMWVHGEDEDRYRQIIRKIKESNINALCVEARPHKDYCGPTWWHDMDIIIDEAKKNNMKVWILDDSHYPTGFANGKLANYDDSLRRQSIVYKTIKAKGFVSVDLSKYFFIKKNKEYIKTDIRYNNNLVHFNDDMLLTVFAYKGNERINLYPYVNNSILNWQTPGKGYTIEFVYLTKNAGTNRNYINMMNRESCEVQIDEVYEPHYAHYKNEFGKTIAGFFSDEPYLGNGPMYKYNITMGSNIDMPYSEELDNRLKKIWKKNYHFNLIDLWHPIDNNKAAKIRYEYMNEVSRLVEEYFSKQIGNWCVKHNVEYIGHLIEDNGLHMKTGAGLAHFFRGLSGQTMAGIDVIGDQVEMFKEGKRKQNLAARVLKNRKAKDGAFWHYTLTKLGGSMAELQPEKKGRCMCEIFGAYGWREGVTLERYLLDHVFVRGVNRLVPHAFTCKDYPDTDYPPHFFAQGNNPEFKHFGKLMKYADKMCSILSNGKNKSQVAIYYNNDSEWVGSNINPYMEITKVAKKLLDNQIDFVFLPIDVLLEKQRYNTTLDNGFKVNGKEIKLLIIPATKYISNDLYNNLETIKKAGCEVVFINKEPEYVLNEKYVGNNTVVTLNEIAQFIDKNGYKDVHLSNNNDRIRVMHYVNENDMFFINNEGKDDYLGEITLPCNANETGIYEYDAFDNVCYKLDYKVIDNKTIVSLNLKSIHSMLLVFDKADNLSKRIVLPNKKEELTNFNVSISSSIDYPIFKNVARNVDINNYNYSNKDKKFTGFIVYETTLDKASKAVLEIKDANDAVEVYVNNKSLGIQVLPPFTYDLSGLLVNEKNSLVIEVASTNERAFKKKFFDYQREVRKVGILNKVYLYKE